MKLAVLSDTHGLLRQAVLERLRGVDAILHGGDINSAGILRTLEAMAPVRVVRGNNDKEWAEGIPEALDFELGGVRIYMTHKKKDLPGDLSPYGLVVYGHSHRYEEGRAGETVLLNPGSCGPRRFNQAVTMAMVYISEAREIRVERIDIPNEPTRTVKLPSDLRSQIEAVVRETRKGRPVFEIAGRYGLDAALVEQIARLYLTHPGVDVEGIMAKMGV